MFSSYIKRSASLASILLLAGPALQAEWSDAIGPVLATSSDQKLIVRLLKVDQEGKVKAGWSHAPLTTAGPEWVKDLRPAGQYGWGHSFFELTRDSSNLRVFLDNAAKLPNATAYFRVETWSGGDTVCEFALELDGKTGASSTRVLKVHPGWEADLGSGTLKVNLAGEGKASGVGVKHESKAAAMTEPEGAGQTPAGLEFPLAGMLKNISGNKWVVNYPQFQTKVISNGSPLLDHSWDELVPTGILEVVQYERDYSEAQNRFCSFGVTREDHRFSASLVWAPDPASPGLAQLRVVEYWDDRGRHKVADGMVLAPGEQIRCQGTNVTVADEEPELGLGLRKTGSGAPEGAVAASDQQL